MLPNPSPGGGDHGGQGGQGGPGGSQGGNQDWNSEESLIKLKGLFIPALQKVLTQVHPNLAAKDESLEYVESLILKLLAMLTSKPAPLSVQDVEERVRKTFPTPIDKWALTEAQTAVGKGRKKSDLVLPVDKIHIILCKEVLQNKQEVSLYIVAVLEYISADILKLTGNYIKQMRRMQISCEDIKVAICADKALMDMFYQEEVSSEEQGVGYLRNRPAQTYDEVVKDLILKEKSYLRDLNMITKVFKQQILKFARPEEIDAIFSNITDIVELTVNLISSLEDTLEMAEEGQVTAVGPCFEELAEAEEFAVYERFTREVLSPVSSQYLTTLLSKPEVSEKLQSSGHGFREAVKFYFPKLILGPVQHCFHYFKYIELLTKLSPNIEDQDILKQVAAMLTPLHNRLSSACAVSNVHKASDVFHRYGPGRQSRQQSLGRLNQLQQTIANWEGKDIVANSSEIVYEGKLKVGTDRKKLKERYVILCDGLLIVCCQQAGGRRPSNSSSNVNISSLSGELRYKDKYQIRHIELYDKEDDDTYRHIFELCQRDQQRVIFKCESMEDKNDWMAALVMLNTKSMLERTLDVILSDEENKHPLRLPDPSLYRFGELDSGHNIIFEEREKSSGVPIIKGATLIKLVERLTYHLYATPVFMKTFLTTYRSFSTPKELLDLLIDRFNIPEFDQSDKSRRLRFVQDEKRFRKEYVQPVQFRVLNVLKHWVDQHFYDFDEDIDLLHCLTSFLDKIQGRYMRKWVENISKLVQRRLDNDEGQKDIQFNFDRSPPPIETHIKNPQEDWPLIMTYHPIEIARQLTIIEYQHYRSVKPSELVDLAWTREDKDKRSPNLLKMVRHTTNFTRYLEKTILIADNMEERISVMQRILEIMMVLQEYNNFHGVLAITSALNSSAVHRLLSTKDRIPHLYLKALEDATSLVDDHFKLYLEKLRSINPPCVPFFGHYQTNILFLEEGNPDFLHNSELINFSKRRKVAEIISEIQQYQNQPYCLQDYPDLKSRLETLDPFPGFQEKEITDFLWKKSVEIEPRASDTIKRKNPERRWPGLSLKSPGIKPKTLPGKNPPNPLPKISSGHTSRHSKDESPLSSPNFGSPSQVFKQSPVSTPVTPSVQTSPREEFGGFRDDPIKISVILPSGPTAAHSIPPMPVGKPPPLPPKPRHVGETPPLPPRDSSPPPPLPPRHPPTRSVSGYISGKPPLESRNPLIEPVFPKRNSIMDTASQPPLIPRSRNGIPEPISPAPKLLDSNTSSSSSTPTKHLPPPMGFDRSSAPGSASWDRPNGPISAGPEMGSHFTFGHHVPSSSNQGGVQHSQFPPNVFMQPSGPLLPPRSNSHKSPLFPHSSGGSPLYQGGQGPCAPPPLFHQGASGSPR